MVYTEVLCSGDHVTMGSEVGLLSHNIRVMGHNYPDIYQYEFGATIITSTILTNTFEEVKGSSKLSNVEFFQCGNFRKNESLIFRDLGDIIDESSFLEDCSFHELFSIGVSVQRTDNLNIKNNVIHRPVGPGKKFLLII